MRAERSTERAWLLWLIGTLSALAGAPATVHAQPKGAASAETSPEYLPNDPSDRDKEARALFEQGKKAYEDGMYREAWGYFRDSYKLSERPQLLYNIGQTADRVGMDADALKAFKMYLDRLPDAQNRREVDNRIRALEERVKNNPNAPAPPPWPEQESGAQPDDAKSEVAPAPPSSGQPRRRGYYFRGALGLGVRHDAVSSTADKWSISGAGAALDLAAGISLMPGFTVGGGLFLEWTSRPTLGQAGQKDITLSTANLTMLGPMVDWYLNPESDGWHLQGALNLAMLNIARGNLATSSNTLGLNTATGFALVLGGGYEWPVQQDWAIGVLGRMTFAGVSDSSISHGFFALSVLGTVTWY